MDLSSRHEEEEDGDIPMPMMIHHHHEPAASSHNNNLHHHQIMNSNGNINLLEDHENQQQMVPYKKVTIRYRECLKNHAAAMGANATDGCGEFMPSGEEGTMEALTCSACNCHRNFHRKEVEGTGTAADQTSPNSCDCFHGPHPNRGQQRRLHLLSHHPHHHHNAILGPAPESLGYPTRPTPHHHQQMIMSYNMGFIPNSDQSDEQEEDIGGGGGPLVRPAHHHQQQLMKKRHRTKFSQEQKEKMLSFAEKVGWKFQKQEESLVQQFCQEIGVKRRVLKVWMHNNKHNLTKKNMMNSIPQTTNSLT